MPQKKNPFNPLYWVLSFILLCLIESMSTPVLAFPFKVKLPFNETAAFKPNQKYSLRLSAGNKITLGNTNILDKDSPAYSKTLVAYRVKLTQTAIIESLYVYISKSSGKMNLGIYTDFFNTPHRLKASVPDFTPVIGWNEKNVSSKVSLKPGYYWLCFQFSSNLATIKASNKGGNSVYYITKKYTTMPSIFPKSKKRGNWHYSFYAILSAEGPKIIPTNTVTKTPTSTPTVSPTTTNTPTSTPTVSPTATNTPTLTPTNSLTSTPTIALHEWYKYRQGKEMLGHSGGSAQMINAPTLKWTFDIASWGGYYSAKLLSGGQNWNNIPYRTTVDTSFFENNKSKWGLGSPYYDLYGNGTLTPIPDNPTVKVADFIQERKGFEKIVMETYNQVGDNARARLYSYNTGFEQQIWESEPFPTCYSPVVSVADANNDGQLDVIISMHYRLVVLNGANGATMMNLRYMNQRNYGFLGIANIDEDPYPEFCIISDFAQHIEVIDNNGMNLSLKWFKQIENSIYQNTCIIQPGPNAFVDVDNDGQVEVICNIFNFNNNNHWSVVVFNASDGAVKTELGYFYLNGLADLNKDCLYEMFLTNTYGLEVSTYGSLSIYSFIPGNGIIRLWTYPNARFNMREITKLPLTVNTMAINGLYTIVSGHVKSSLREDFFISEPGPNPGGETCKCFGFDDNNQIQNWLTFLGPNNSKLEVLASKDIDQPGDGNEILLSVKTRGNPDETIVSINNSMELKQWGRKLPQYIATPVAADLEGDGKMEILTVTGDDEVICLEAPQFGTGSSPLERWRMKGQGMTKDAGSRQDGVLVADLDNDGIKEVIFARESYDGKASIVVVHPDGSIKWQHIFPGFDGSPPVWNSGGITYWVAGNFTTKFNLDIYVSIRRSKMHSDVGFLLSGLNGNVLWESDGVLLPGGNPIDDKRGHGGDRIACADMDKDGLDELVCAYPDRVYIVNGLTGNPTVIKSTAESLFPQKWVAYGVPVLVDFIGNTKPEIFYGRCGYITALLDNDCNVAWERDFNASGNDGCNYLQGIGDYNKDGNLEIGGIYKNSTGEYEFRFYKGFSGEICATYPLLPGFGSPCTDVVTADLDGDGCDEFLFGQGSSLQCMGKNGLKWSLNLDAIPSDIALADSDRDGNLEIIVCTSDGYIRVYK